MYHIIKKYICFILCSLIVFLSGCSNFNILDHQLVSKTGFYFDTTIQIKVYHDNGEKLIEECFALCAEMENIFSKTKEQSELYKLNHRTTDTVVVSDDLAKVISLGLEYSELTNGIFDITICPVSDLWDFKSDTSEVPSDERILQELEKVDYRRVHQNGNNISFDSKDTMLDLGAVAKGYAADKIKEYLVSRGVASGFINFGGNVQTIGTKPDRNLWKIGIQEPFKDRGTIIETVEVDDQSVVSAGIYERYFEIDGKKYYHILDPRTGYPVETDLDQMTVICDDSALGDVLSTCCILMGEEDAKAFLDAIGFSNIWLHLDNRCAMIRQ